MFNPRFPYKSICFCGPTSAETGLQGQETSFMGQYSSAFNQNFAQQQQVLGAINAQLSPILAKGINQTGFSAPEEAAFNTQAINTTGAGVKNAEVALGNQTAAVGNSTIESGVQQQLKAGLASNAENQLSNEQLGITAANYAQGRQNYLTALGGMQGLATAYNPTPYGQLTQTAEGQSFQQASTIEQQQAQEDQAIAGGITSAATAAVGGIGNLDTTGSSSGGEQFLNFLGGM
jgi:hypothetical protein